MKQVPRLQSEGSILYVDFLDIEEYRQWLRERHGVDITDKVRNHYELVTTKMKAAFENSAFWKQLVSNLDEFNDEYIIDTGYPLLYNKLDPPILKIKPWDSFLDKTRRKNIVENPNYPKAPPDGWTLPNNWYSKINDILRTILVVKYLDGAHFLVKKTRSLCQESNNKYFSCDYEATEEGYYAVHMYITEEFEIPRIDWDTERVSAKVEIQITTQIQEVIRKLIHKYYEEKRGKVSPAAERVWQWDYTSDEFIPNYLGHILHYVEGMIMEIRDREKNYDKV